MPKFSNLTNLSPKQFQTLLKNKNFTLINVHTPYEGEIEKTDLFIPYDQVVAFSNSLPKDKNTPIILYCRTGRMSSVALSTFAKLGYTNVKHLSGGWEAYQKQGGKLLNLKNITSEVLPENGIELPVSWGDLGPRLVKLGVIDLAKFRQAVKLTEEQEKILTTNYSGKIKIDATNAQFVVDMLWALGLAQKSLVYEEGPMGKEYKKEVGNFASTGGWTLGATNALNYYNKFDLISPTALTAQKQQKVAQISKNIYRPCCGNPTWFPDCNHGMAALAIIELLVSNNIDEATIYKKVLGFNSFWFTDTYLTLATYFARQGILWRDIDAQMVLGKDYSSGQGASRISQKVGPLPYGPTRGSSCGT